MTSETPLRVGISSCLLGREVRWDGGHKRDRFLTEALGPFVEWVPVCPEVEIGMGIPRESVRLVRGDEGAPRMRGNRSGRDWTAKMQRYARARARALAKWDLCGYVLKKDSPSCGMERVRVHGARGMPQKKGRGLFAQALLDACPHLPVEEEGRLHDPRLRESWIERLFAYRRLRDLFRARWGVGDLVRFHTAHKLQIMAHAPKAYRELGRLVGDARELPRAELRRRYEGGFMSALETRATPRRHVNVLHHMVGFLKERLDPRSKRELLAVVEDYRRGLVPLVVPVVLVRHHAHRLDVAYLLGQHYLEPHPKELMLRNHV